VKGRAPLHGRTVRRSASFNRGLASVAAPSRRGTGRGLDLRGCLKRAPSGPAGSGGTRTPGLPVEGRAPLHGRTVRRSASLKPGSGIRSRAVKTGTRRGLDLRACPKRSPSDPPAAAAPGRRDSGERSGPVARKNRAPKRFLKTRVRHP